MTPVLVPGSLIVPGCGWKFVWSNREVVNTNPGPLRLRYNVAVATVAFVVSIDEYGYDSVRDFTAAYCITSDGYVGEGHVYRTNVE